MMVQYPNPFDRSFTEHHELIPPPPPPPPPLDPTSYFFPFSPPTFHDDSFRDLLLTPHHFPIPADAPPGAPSPTKQRPTGTMSSRGAGRPDRKRALRKDRHSKIFTAQGARDRRMRLSIEVARNFFDLQDTLGFDKASKTVQWLLTKSGSAIRDLSGTSRPKGHDFSLSSTSECENTSTVSDYKGKPSVEATETLTPKVKPKTPRAPRRAVLNPMLARESRATARARARERTREKRINQLASSSNPFQTIADESSSHSLAPAMKLEDKCSSSRDEGKKALDEIGYESLARAGLNHIFDYNHNFIGNHYVDSLFQEQCGMNMVVVGNVEERVDILDDMQFHVRPWEILDNNSIL